MSAFLKLIGSAENPCPEFYEKSYVDFSRNPRQVQPGDHLVLYAAGGLKRVFAIAEVMSGVYDAGSDYDGRWPYRVDIRYIVGPVPASKGVHVNEVSTSERDLLRSVRRASYLKLSPEEYEQATAKLQQKA
ncbi:MAG: EVE domain-containing protein [Acidobacteriota bacterium]|nr:EVE domain-containing protein [Acidobacteriota bacterium]MDQ5835745.1 EVE domain-containing protein [Acidobacteriota bacterium]